MYFKLQVIEIFKENETAYWHGQKMNLYVCMYTLYNYLLRMRMLSLAFKVYTVLCEHVFG